MEGATFYVRDMEEWDPLTEIAVLLESLVKIVRHVVLLGKATALVNFRLNLVSTQNPKSAAPAPERQKIANRGPTRLALYLLVLNSEGLSGPQFLATSGTSQTLPLLTNVWIPLQLSIRVVILPALPGCRARSSGR